MKFSSLQKNKGFTLLETLVTIGIMITAIGAAFSMAQKSLSSSYLIKNQTTAYFLAAEGLELVRNVRDNVALYNSAVDEESIIDWLLPLAPCKADEAGGGCDIDASSAGLNIVSGVLANQGSVISCPVNDPQKPGCQIRQKSYGQTNGSLYISTGEEGVPTIFYRKIQMFETADGVTGKKEALVRSRVFWMGQDIMLEETLTDWR